MHFLDLYHALQNIFSRAAQKRAVGRRYSSERDEIILDLENYIRAHHPCGQPTDYVRYLGGERHRHYLAKNQREHYVIRMRNPNRKKRGKELSLADEATVLNSLARLGIAPEPYFHDNNRFFCPASFYGAHPRRHSA